LCSLLPQIDQYGCLPRSQMPKASVNTQFKSTTKQ